MADGQQQQQQQKTDEDDDGEALVREVIAENPVPERGIRDEWEGQVGWHRQEDIHNAALRGAKKKRAEAAAKEEGDVDILVESTNKTKQQDLQKPAQQQLAYKGGLWVVVFGAVVLFLHFFCLRSRKKRHSP